MALLWTQKQDVGPAGRIFPAMTFDASRERVVLFGGQVAGGDTYGGHVVVGRRRLDAGLRHGPIGTSRERHGLRYRARASRARSAAFPITGALADTWEWDGAEWTQVADTGPGARALNGLAYDAAREQVVLFGGADSAGNVLDDTWAWDGTEWTQVADTGPDGAVHPRNDVRRRRASACSSSVA